MTLNKTHKGVGRRYLHKTRSYSRQQLIRLIQQYKETDKLEQRCRAGRHFPQCDTEQDIIQPVHTDI